MLHSPRRLFTTLARAEVVTWALLLTGMFLKYVTKTTDLGVQVFGMLHGVVFLSYCLVTVLVSIDTPWSLRRAATSLAAAIPPLATLLVERSVERHSLLAEAWRLRATAPRTPLERLAAWVLRNPLIGLMAGLVTLALLTGFALYVGPPTSWF